MRQAIVKKAKFYQIAVPPVSAVRMPRLIAIMITLPRIAFATAGFAMLINVAAAATTRTCTAASGPQRVAVIELYTSEGCDSCPPTDKWVSELPARKLGPERLIPLAFHVDYWDRLGWSDPFAQTRYSERQRQHSRRRGASFVYTPQLLLNGQDYRRGMLLDDIDSKVKSINQTRPLADIKLTLERSDLAMAVAAAATPVNTNLRTAQLYLALVENNLSTAVKAGENKGRTLRHDFVVRELAGPFAQDGGGARREHTFRLDPRWKTQDLVLAAFMQDPHSGDVLQALAARCP
jgi:hypothetical protein